MRRLVQYLAFIAISIFYAVTLPREARSQWTKLEAPGLAGSYFWWIEFESASTGYAIGSKAGIINLYKTNDGGLTWKALKGLGVVPFTFTFIDEQRGFAAGRSAGCKCMAIARTTDGGGTWKLDSMRSKDGGIDRLTPDLGINSISFANANASTGFAAGPNGSIFRTTDGGERWSRLEGRNDDDVMAIVHSATPRTAHILAGTSDQRIALYRTADSGASWERRPDFIALAVADLFFTGPEVGFMVGTDDRAAIYKTTDGGASWTRKHAAGDSESIFTRIAFESASTGYAVGSEGRIVRTTDGGESWSEEASGSGELLQGITIRDGVAYAISTEGTLLRRAQGQSSVPPGSGDAGDLLRLTGLDLRF